MCTLYTIFNFHHAVSCVTLHPVLVRSSLCLMSSLFLLLRKLVGCLLRRKSEHRRSTVDSTTSGGGPVSLPCPQLPPSQTCPQQVELERLPRSFAVRELPIPVIRHVVTDPGATTPTGGLQFVVVSGDLVSIGDTVSVGDGVHPVSSSQVTLS